MATICFTKDPNPLFGAVIPLLEQEGFMVSRWGEHAPPKTVSHAHPPLPLIQITNLDESDDTWPEKRVSAGQPQGEDSPLTIVLSQKPGDQWVIDALEHGADDCMRIPFDPKELLARIKSLIRRTERCRIAEPAREPLVFGNISFVFSRKNLIHPESRTSFTPAETVLLKALLSQPERLIRKEELIRSLREDPRTIRSNVINVHVASLRRKLRAIAALPSTSPIPVIETVWRVGYRISFSG